MKKIRKIYKRAKKKISNINFFKIYITYRKNICMGYKNYKRLLKGRDPDTELILHPWPGVGDIFLLHLYFDEYLRKNEVRNCSVIVVGGAAKKIVELFGVSDITTFLAQEALQLTQFWVFMKTCVPRLTILHHDPPGMRVGIMNKAQGINGLTTRELLLEVDMGLSQEESLTENVPGFSSNVKKAESLLKSHGLQIGKTVIFAPYSNSCSSVFPKTAWEELARILKKAGYSVCTNCAGEEKPVKGTEALFFPFKDSLAVLEAAGYFVANRSGFCDIIGRAKCKKVILYHYGLCCGPSSIIDYWRLDRIGLGDDAVEIEYHPADLPQIMRTIIQEIAGDAAFSCYDADAFARKHRMSNPIHPAFNGDSVPIVVPVENFSAPLAAMLVNNIISNASPSRNYDILIFGISLSFEVSEVLAQLVSDTGNVSLRVIPLESMYSMLVPGNLNAYSRFSLARLTVPRVLPEYSKVITISADSCVHFDVARLSDIDISNCSMAALPAYVDSDELAIRQLLNKKTTTRKELIGITGNHIDPGIIILNLNRIRDRITSFDIFHLCFLLNWRYYDYEILSVLLHDDLETSSLSEKVVLQYEIPGVYCPDEKYASVRNFQNPFWNRGIGAGAVRLFRHACLKERPEERVLPFWALAKNTPYFELLRFRAFPDYFKTICLPKKRLNRRKKVLKRIATRLAEDNKREKKAVMVKTRKYW